MYLLLIGSNFDSATTSDVSEAVVDATFILCTFSTSFLLPFFSTLLTDSVMIMKQTIKSTHNEYDE